MNSILILARKKEVLDTLFSYFSQEYEVAKTQSANAALEVLQKKRYDLIFIDLEILGKSSKEYKKTFQLFWAIFPTIEIIILSSKKMIRETMMAVKAGATNYLNYPLNLEELKYIIESTRESHIIQSELDYLREQFWEFDVHELIETNNPEMQKVFRKIGSVAPTKSTVLLIGETGTGKNLLANLIHKHSNRKDGPFISVQCSAIPDTLLESELFGHEKGAFTGAERRKLGKFETAHKGTIFLDEIGTIIPSAQIKLLHVLQDLTFQRLGGVESINVDVRLIAATNTDLKKLIEEDQFRKDLYYRINVFPIEIPPLRERLEDIPHLAELILRKMNKFFSKEIYGIHPLVIEAFQQYSWPGNIRELENLIERAFVLESSSVLCPESFPNELFEPETSLVNIIPDASIDLAKLRRQAVEDIERLYLKNLLTKNKGKIKDSAAMAGFSTRQLHKLMKKYGFQKERFKSLV